MSALYANDASVLDSIGRLMIVTLYIVLGLRNLTAFQIKDHIAKLTGSHTPMPAAAFWAGFALECVGVALVLLNWHAALGVICLIAFTVLASALLHRFWEVDDVGRRTALQNGFMQNVAIVGGLLLLLQNVR